MGRPRKNTEMQTGHFTNAEIDQRMREQDMIEVGNARLKEIPEYLSDAAKTIWRDAVKYNVMVDDMDYENLAVYCEVTAKIQNAIRNANKYRMNEEKFMYYWNVVLKTAPEQRRYADLCGMSKNARLKMAAVKVKQEDNAIETKFGSI